ncbi:CoA-binding protein [Aurantimonas sp. VKM B-3413]|uniref:CoA-binding protein n=1 Tax=Aurantimonas sp. VKM B-3413 TaxID=2779401 RepID=UPI001E2A16BC|nr:CoA-binding protein [Aurantimonas sp. VKM B-3413]MCB8836933.1 CoA-binding protein [Aurantimonas sp. VKM B-3413]
MSGQPSADAGARPARLVYDDAMIRTVLSETKTIAMVGASAKEIRPSYFVLKYLLAKGFHVIPINPGLAGGQILGQTVYADLASVPEAIDMVDIFRSSDAVPGIVDEALALEPLPKVIWMQLSVRHDGAAAKAEDAGLTVIMDRCPKIEYARLSGEIGWNGVNSRVLSSKKPTLGKGFQSFGLNPARRG